MRQILQRLRTLDTRCGNRVRSIPNNHESVIHPSTTFSRTGKNTETHTIVVVLCRATAPFAELCTFRVLHQSALSRKENSSSGSCQRLWPGSCYRAPLSGVSRSRRPGWAYERSSHFPFAGQLFMTIRLHGQTLFKVVWVMHTTLLGSNNDSIAHSPRA